MPASGRELGKRALTYLWWGSYIDAPFLEGSSVTSIEILNTHSLCPDRSTSRDVAYRHKCNVSFLPENKKEHPCLNVRQKYHAPIHLQHQYLLSPSSVSGTGADRGYSTQDRLHFPERGVGQIMNRSLYVTRYGVGVGEGPNLSFVGMDFFPLLNTVFSLHFKSTHTRINT